MKTDMSGAARTLLILMAQHLQFSPSSCSEWTQVASELYVTDLVHHTITKQNLVLYAVTQYLFAILLTLCFPFTALSFYFSCSLSFIGVCYGLLSLCMFH